MRSAWQLIRIALVFSLLTGCSLVRQDSLPTAPATLQGAWSGTLNDRIGSAVYTAGLVLEQQQGGSAIEGTLTLTDPTGTFSEQVYHVTGQFDGTRFQFAEPEGRVFQGLVDQAGMHGQAAWCLDCEAWGELELSLNPVTTAATASTPSITVRFTELQDGTVLTPVLAENGLPLVVSAVETGGPLPAGYAIALEADGLWVSQAITQGRDPLQASLQWTPWHGNGTYMLNLQVLGGPDASIVASQTVQVEVAGIPEGTATVQERIVQLYWEQFGLTLTSPPFARYTQPDEYAMEASRWVSAAYIGDKMYEVSIFDNGFAGGMAYHLDSGENGFCRPAGTYSMLVVFVDYGNTGVDINLGPGAMEAWRQHANQVWAEYSSAIGLAEPVLQIDPMETAIVSAPPVPGQPLTAEQVRTLTGKDPANFDWLVEIELDAENQVAGQYGGVGISLNGACLPGGAQRVNIAYSALDETGLTQEAPGNVFAHEMEHGMGWQHWWPNGLANNADQLAKGLFWMPTLLFGWTDTDGDGIIEILDPSTPYGLQP
jgi:hypothetical protein